MNTRIAVITFTALAAFILLACSRTETVVNTNANLNGNTSMTHDMSNMNGHDMSNMNAHDMSMMDQMPVSAPNAAQQPYDLQFIDTMIVHHEGAIKMSQMVIGKTQRPELKAFAQKIIDDQTAEIAQLKQWRDAWYAGKPSAINMDMPGMMNEGMKMMSGEHMKKMDEMKPAHLDRHFLDMMSSHHEGAIDMAKQALTKAEHREIKDLANRIITAQSAEIKQMDTWAKAWKE
ncbi:MAG TPA: DUF305 domain-containing protein [Pyrinomonadaceae bacterium]|nr:DUF305 domain-containing protein [Pyrinomonadaceae bacterium]